MRISDWSSDVCSSDLGTAGLARGGIDGNDADRAPGLPQLGDDRAEQRRLADPRGSGDADHPAAWRRIGGVEQADGLCGVRRGFQHGQRSEEHTSELQSLMRNSYAVFCLKKKKQ